MRHPNNIMHAMALQGYGPEAMLGAYEGWSVADVEQLWIDTALSQDRPVRPYGTLGIRPARSRYFNFTEHGFRGDGTDQPWPPRRDHLVVFCFGNSTTLGFNVADDQTVPAALQARLRARGVEADVYNFGQNTYTSRHAFVSMLDLADRGIFPDVAVILEGFNESHYAFGNPNLVRHLDRLYQTERRQKKLPLFAAIADGIGRTWREHMAAIPDSFSWALPPEYERFSWYMTDEAVAHALSAPDDHPGMPLDDAVADLAWRNYRTSVGLIEALGAEGGCRPLFAWQPVALFATRPQQRLLERLYYTLRQGSLCAPVYRSLARRGFPGMAARPNFIDLSRLVMEFDGLAYIDHCHYTPRFAIAIAERLAGEVMATISGRS